VSQSPSDTPDTAAQGLSAQAGRDLPRDQYLLVCLLIVATILSTSVLGDGVVGLLLTLFLMIVTLAVALRTSGAGMRPLLVGSAVAGVSVVAIVIAVLIHNATPARLAYGVAMLVLSVLTPVVIARRLLAHPRVGLSTVTGAAAIYLLLGLLFAVVYSLIGSALALVAGHGGGSGAFFLASRPVGASDFVYYSFATLTTVGYGDLTASTDIGRMVSICEALLGQLYLVTVVAVLVSNIGRGRPPRAHEADAQPDASADDAD